MIKQLTWAEARPLLEAGEPDLVHIIDEISPGKDLPFIKVRYPFGTIIKEERFIRLPNGLGWTEPLNGPNIETKWAEQLNYTSVPLGILTHNTIEFFRQFDDTIFSLFVAEPNKGLQIGVGDHVGIKSSFSISSGARSLYMVPRISNQQAHRRLQRQYDIQHPAPRRMTEHCALFKTLHEPAYGQNPWYSEILFLSRAWAERFDDASMDWLRLKNHIQSNALSQSTFGERKVVFDFFWQNASESITAKGLKPSPYIVDTLKHLLLIAVGGACGFRPFNGGDAIGPMSCIQRIYADEYKLQGQLPTIMRPCSLMRGDQKPVYYSMQLPTMISSSPTRKVSRSILDDMRELMEITRVVLAEEYEDLSVYNSGRMVDLNELLHEISIECFHEEIHSQGTMIRPIEDMVREDAGWAYVTSEAKSISDKFATNGAFVRGCIKVARNSAICA